MGYKKRPPLPGKVWVSFLDYAQPFFFSRHTVRFHTNTSNSHLYTDQPLNHPHHQHHDSQLLLQYVLVHELQRLLLLRASVPETF